MKISMYIPIIKYLLLLSLGKSWYDNDNDVVDNRNDDDDDNGNLW